MKTSKIIMMVAVFAIATLSQAQEIKPTEVKKSWKKLLIGK